MRREPGTQHLLNRSRSRLLPNSWEGQLQSYAVFQGFSSLSAHLLLHTVCSILLADRLVQIDIKAGGVSASLPEVTLTVPPGARSCAWCLFSRRLNGGINCSWGVNLLQIFKNMVLSFQPASVEELFSSSWRTGSQGVYHKLTLLWNHKVNKSRDTVEHEAHR